MILKALLLKKNTKRVHWYYYFNAFSHIYQQQTTPIF